MGSNHYETDCSILYTYQRLDLFQAEAGQGSLPQYMGQTEIGDQLSHRVEPQHDHMRTVRPVVATNVDPLIVFYCVASCKLQLATRDSVSQMRLERQTGAAAQFAANCLLVCVCACM